MRLSELQKKDIVTTDGRLVGNIIDIIIEDGIIKSMLVEKGKFIISMFSSKDEMTINWSQIKTIGEDVIIVD